jgi:hypothetical protein
VQVRVSDRIRTGDHLGHKPISSAALKGAEKEAR